MGLPSALRVLAGLAYFSLLARTQILSFVDPNTDFIGDNSNLTYTLRKDVTFSWKSQCDQTTLILFQGPLSDGAYSQDTLVANASSTVTTYVWTAAAIADTSLAYGYHLFLANGTNYSCDGCAINSVPFRVSQNALSTTSTTQSATATVTHATSGSATASAIPSDSHLALALGVGLGLGVPLLLALCAAIGFCVFRRRSGAKNLPRGRPVTRPESQEPINGSYGHGYQPSSDSSMVQSQHPSYLEPFPFQIPGRKSPGLWPEGAAEELHGESFVPEMAAAHERWELDAGSSPDPDVGIAK